MAGKCRLIATCFVLVGTCWVRAEIPGPNAANGSSDDHVLVWADDFNQDGRPDPINWVYEHGFVRNEELQWYQPDNASCKDGLLVIEARRERKPNPDYDPNNRSW